ncbi:MAG: hypothetical protein ACOC7U_01930 [Spirochaetota bacterium]
MIKTIQDRGYCPYVTNPDEVKEISSASDGPETLFLDQAKKLDKHLD